MTEPKTHYTRKGSAKVSVEEVHFYTDEAPPRLIAKRPADLFVEQWGDLDELFVSWGTNGYDSLVAVKYEPRYPGAESAYSLRIQYDLQARLSSVSLPDTGGPTQSRTSDGMHSPQPATPPTASPGPISQAPPAQPVTATGVTVHASLGARDQQQQEPGQGANPLCASCGKPAAGLSFCPHCGVKQ